MYRDRRLLKRSISIIYRLITANEFWLTSLAVGLIVGTSNLAFANAGDETQSQFKVASCAPDNVLTEKFQRLASGTFQNSLTEPFEKHRREKFEWAGADAAYSIPIGNGKTLWLFGDTFLRPRGTSLQMVNNSVAIQQIRDGQVNNIDHDPLKFFWRQTHNNNHSFFEDANANSAGHWLWPLDGISANGKLFEFINEIRKSENATPAFGFATTKQLFLKVENVGEPADKWKMTFSNIEAPDVQVGNAVTQDEQFAYVYCSYYPAREGMNQHPQVVIRLPLDKLDKLNKSDARDLYKTAEVWGSNGRWIKSSTGQPKIVMQDGAPEFSVTRVKGFEGYFAVYFPSGFGTKIMLRHAPRPEGPWSELQCIYDCPVDAERFFVYSAKSHPELCTNNGELCVTYCENIKSSDLTSLAPEKFYFPHAIRLRIETVNSRSELVR
jgi:hypothetical protein